MPRKSLLTKDKNLLLTRISGILETKTSVLFAYVFGSFVSGDDFGDVDIAVFADIAGTRQSPMDFELSTERELEDALRMPVDVKIINTAPLSFVYNVLKHKVVVVDKDATLRADFESAVYKNYFDFMHLRREYIREIINAPL